MKFFLSDEDTVTSTTRFNYSIVILIVLLLAALILYSVKKQQDVKATQVRDLSEIDNDVKEYLLTTDQKKRV